MEKILYQAAQVILGGLIFWFLFSQFVKALDWIFNSEQERNFTATNKFNACGKEVTELTDQNGDVIYKVK